MEKAGRFATAAEALRRGLSARTPRLRGRSTVVDLALGHESRVKRHLTRLTAARQRILSYLERGDLTAIDRAVSEGFPVLRRISRNDTLTQLELSIHAQDRQLFDCMCRGLELFCHLQPIGCTERTDRGGHMSTIATDRIEKKIQLRHPRSKVWRALTDSQEFGNWFGAVFTEQFKPGVSVRGRVTHKGYEHMTMDVTIERMEPERLFS